MLTKYIQFAAVLLSVLVALVQACPKHRALRAHAPNAQPNELRNTPMAYM